MRREVSRYTFCVGVCAIAITKVVSKSMYVGMEKVLPIMPVHLKSLIFSD